MKKTMLVILTVILCLIIVLPTCSLATEINTNDYKDIYSNKGNSKLTSAGGNVLGVVQVIGISAGIICLIILAIKYMMMSIDPGEKAKIKEKLIPYAIGAVLLFGGTGLLSIIANFAQKVKL